MANKKQHKNGDNSGRIAIIVALIGTFGVIVAALIGVLPTLLQTINHPPTPTVQASTTLMPPTSISFVASPFQLTPSPTPTFAPASSPTATSTTTMSPRLTLSLTAHPTTDFNFVPATFTPTQTTSAYPCDGTVKGNAGVELNQVRVLPQQNAPSRPRVEEGSTITILAKQFNDQLNWFQIRYANDTNTGWIPIEYVSPSANCQP